MSDAVTHGVLQGCAATAQVVPDMTVAIAAGFVINGNTAAAVSGQNATITAADPTLDRYDAITVSTAGTVTVTAGTPADPPAQPESSDVILAYVLVYNQANALYTGTITSSVIQDVRSFIFPQIPANSLTYTFLSGAQANADPGSGKCGFDAATNSGVSHLYISTSTSSSPLTVTNWLENAAQVPFYLKLWPRSNPGHWWLGKVTTYTPNTGYVDLSVKFVVKADNQVGAPGTQDPANTLSVASLDTIIQVDSGPATTFAPTSYVTTADQIVNDSTQIYLDELYEIGSNTVTELVATSSLLDIDAAPGGFVSGTDSSGGYIEILGGGRIR